MLARNTILNIIGQVMPMFIAVVTLPFIVRGLGTDRFGLMSLAWVVLGYFAIFDIGLGRATTKFVAEALGKRDEEEVPRLVWTSVTIQAIMGVIGGIVLVGITPLLVERVLNIPPELIGEAQITFYLLALSIPIILVTGSFSGVLEAAQRFDLINAVRITTSSLTYFLPLVGLLLGFKLPGIMVLILLVRFGTLAIFIFLNLRLTPELKKYTISFDRFRPLFYFGSWVMITSIVGPLLIYFDRFLIGSILSLAAVAYYSAPYEAVTRLCFIPSSMMMTLFPAFSSLNAVDDDRKQATLFTRAIKYVLLFLGPIIFLIIIFAEEILQIWLGAEFAVESTTVLQILAFGVLMNSLAFTPFGFLQGIGRPDLPAKFHLLELPIHFGITWFFVGKWGISGAAAAWTLRVTLDNLLLFGACCKVKRITPKQLLEKSTIFVIFGLVALGSGTYIMKLFAAGCSLIFQSLLAVIFLALFALFAWKIVLDESERDLFLNVVRLKRKFKITL